MALPLIRKWQVAFNHKVIKKHFNETVQRVQQTENSDDKRAVLKASFSKMITAIDKIESVARLSDEELAQLTSVKK